MCIGYIVLFGDIDNYVNLYPLPLFIIKDMKEKKLEKIEYIASACLCGIPCRYNAGSKPDEEVVKLMKEGKVFPVCPEVWAGCKIPRPAADVINGKVIEKDGTDVTKQYVKGAKMCTKVAIALKVKKSFLKKGSPSCGKNGVFTKCLQDEGIKLIFKKGE